MHHLSSINDSAFSMEDVRDVTAELLQQFEELDRVTEPAGPHIQQQPLPQPDVNVAIPPTWVEGQGLQRRRRREATQVHTLPPLPERGHGQYYVPSISSANPMDSCSERSYYWPPQHQTTAGASSSHAAYHSYGPDEAYVPSAPSPSQFTPPAYMPPEFTPDAPMGFMDFLSQETLYTPRGVNVVSPQGIDLNEEFLSVANPEDDEADVRRNPRRRARDRRRVCILSPNSPHD